METLPRTSTIGARAGDADPIQAVEDALLEFPANGILIAGDAADPDLESALRRFELPVTRLQAPPLASHSRSFRTLRSLAGGRADATPFVLLIGVNASFLVVALLISAVVLLLLRAAGTI
jgi:hypothetical protein